MKRLISHIKKVISYLWIFGMSSEEYVHYLRKHGIRVGEKVNFRGPADTTIDFTRPCLVELGNNLDINHNFSILTHDFGTFVFRNYYKDFVNSSGKVKIGDNIVFGRDVTILKGSSIGDNCIIGAGSIVSGVIPSNSVAVGRPAKVVCSLDDYYNKRKAIQEKEAIEYAKELVSYKGGIDKLKIEDFTEEWVIFLSEEEYNANEGIRKAVDFRLKGRIDIHEYLNRPRPYCNFKSFLDAVEESIKADKQ